MRDTSQALITVHGTISRDASTEHIQEHRTQNGSLLGGRWEVIRKESLPRGDVA
jgi:hypothetical protein